MNPTEKLRRMLTEAGMKWKAKDSLHEVKGFKIFRTRWNGNCFYEELYSDGESYTILEARAIDNATPEQAIAATLDPGTCKIMRINGFMEYIECSECGYRLFDSGCIDISEWNFCPNCRRRVVDE